MILQSVQREFHLYTGQQLKNLIDSELSDKKYNTKLLVEVEDQDMEKLKQQAQDDKRKDMKARQVLMWRKAEANQEQQPKNQSMVSDWG